jgi:hypothetical protein
MYCPICQHTIDPIIVNGERLWVHDDLEHPQDWCDDDLEFAAMMAGLQ